ncbi:hypothetical protein CHARACLAT_025429 [Characodon lateralis]|uniref:Uncharacterized protein n=1 Tax=Characodon lateralis TaxID=208331 RepID=A0ABU7D9Z9_9TELE|nr:hypothetical protein [Characodon lateralis]
MEEAEGRQSTAPSFWSTQHAAKRHESSGGFKDEPPHIHVPGFPEGSRSYRLWSKFKFPEGSEDGPPQTQVPDSREGCEDETPLTMAPGQTDSAPEPTDHVPGTTDKVPEEPRDGPPPRLGPEHLLVFLLGVSLKLLSDFRPPDSMPDDAMPEATLDNATPESKPDARSSGFLPGSKAQVSKYLVSWVNLATPQTA